MSTIFGEEHFIDTTMINLIEQRNNAIDDFVFQQMENVITGSGFIPMPQVVIDKEKLKKWITLCMKLENIEQSELIDMATKKKIADLEAKLAESKKPKEIRFNGFVIDCNYEEARKILQEDILKMQAENKKLKESEELSNYAKCILENKKLEEDLELSEKCCVEYEQEITELKQQLAEKEKEKEIESLKASSDKNIDYLIEFASLIDNEKDCNRMLKALDRVKKGKKYIVDKTNQDKISFAVEQLEKVKEWCKKKFAWWENSEWEGDIYDKSDVSNAYFDIEANIDNQIEELKKEMK